MEKRLRVDNEKKLTIPYNIYEYCVHNDVVSQSAFVQQQINKNHVIPLCEKLYQLVMLYIVLQKSLLYNIFVFRHVGPKDDTKV